MSKIRELNQLKNHLARIEEICIELIKSREDVEENYEHVVGDLKEQLRIANNNLANDQVAVAEDVETSMKQREETSNYILVDQQNNGIQYKQQAIPTDKQIALEKREQLKMRLESLKETNPMSMDILPNYQRVISDLGSNEMPISSQ